MSYYEFSLSDLQAADARAPAITRENGCSLIPDGDAHSCKQYVCTTRPESNSSMNVCANSGRLSSDPCRMPHLLLRHQQGSPRAVVTPSTCLPRADGMSPFFNRQCLQLQAVAISRCQMWLRTWSPTSSCRSTLERITWLAQDRCKIKFGAPLETQNSTMPVMGMRTAEARLCIYTRTGRHVM